MIKWTKVDPVTGQPVKRGEGRSFMPHNYRADGEHLGALILNESFSRTRGGWALATRKGSEIARFDTLKAAKAYAETLF